MLDELAAMKGTIENVIGQWSVSCAVTRNTGTINDQGKKTTTFTSVATGQAIAIRPLTITDRNREEQGIVEGTTHTGYASADSFAVREGDRITAAGESNYYDVLGVENPITHRIFFLRKVGA